MTVALNPIVDGTFAKARRSAQIRRDIRAGFLYVVELADGDVPIAMSDNAMLSAVVDGRDLLTGLADAPEASGLGRLPPVEEYSDLYVSMRNGRSSSCPWLMSVSQM